MSMYDQGGDYSGLPSSHGKNHPFRFDPSTTLALFVVGALLVLGLLHIAFKGSVGAGFAVGGK